MTSPQGQEVSASLDPEVALALENLVLHTAMEDAQVALECEAILKRALSAPPPAVSEVREAVARIVDPLTWGKIDKVMSGGLDSLIPEGWSREQYATSCYYEERRDSFAKADQIIALQGQSPSVESGRVEDDWITWNGGENPAPGKVVQYRLSSGGAGWGSADDLDWRPDVGPYTIIAYRIIPHSDEEGET